MVETHCEEDSAEDTPVSMPSHFIPEPEAPAQLVREPTKRSVDLAVRREKVHPWDSQTQMEALSLEMVAEIPGGEEEVLGEGKEFFFPWHLGNIKATLPRVGRE